MGLSAAGSERRQRDFLIAVPAMGHPFILPHVIHTKYHTRTAVSRSDGTHGTLAVDRVVLLIILNVCHWESPHFLQVLFFSSFNNSFLEI